MHFMPNPPIDPLHIIQLIQTQAHIQLNGQDRLKITPPKARDFDQLEQRLEQIRQVLKRLNQSALSTV